MPPYDPAGARDAARSRRATRAAPTLGPISFIANGGGYDRASITMLEENLGVTIDYATMDFATYQDRLATDPPRMWSISWVADYPGPNDFLGVLLGTGSTANQGGWSIARVRRRDRRRDVRRRPGGRDRRLRPARWRSSATRRRRSRSRYGTSFSLVRDGLLGASQNGLGILRLAGLAWAVTGR